MRKINQLFGEVRIVKKVKERKTHDLLLQTPNLWPEKKSLLNTIFVHILYATK
jgi:hypothetical protein